MGPALTFVGFFLVFACRTEASGASSADRDTITAAPIFVVEAITTPLHIISGHASSTPATDDSWGSFFSKTKNGGQSADVHQPITGIKCGGDSCSELALQSSPSNAFSGISLGWKSVSLLTLCEGDSFVTRIRCKNDKCAAKDIRCSKLKSGYAVGAKQTKGKGSDGTFSCDDGFALQGLMCSGTHCDEFQILCAKITEAADETTNPEEPAAAVTTAASATTEEVAHAHGVFEMIYMERGAPWVIPTIVASVLVVVAVVIASVIAGIKGAAARKRTEELAKDDDVEAGTSSRLTKKSDAELQDIIDKDEEAIKRYKTLAKEGRESEYESNLSVNDLKELVSDLGY